MSEEEKSDVDQIEYGRSRSEATAQGHDNSDYVDHRENDDRADEARGRNADKFGKNYWLSVNFIGTMFAIGMAFAGGIGGKLHSFEAPCVEHC